MVRKELLDTLSPASLEYTVVIKKLCFKYGRKVKKTHPRMVSIPKTYPSTYSRRNREGKGQRQGQVIPVDPNKVNLEETPENSNWQNSRTVF